MYMILFSNRQHKDKIQTRDILVKEKFCQGLGNKQDQKINLRFALLSHNHIK